MIPERKKYTEVCAERMEYSIGRWGHQIPHRANAACAVTSNLGEGPDFAEVTQNPLLPSKYHIVKVQPFTANQL
jgi:hypothetical protein